MFILGGLEKCDKITFLDEKAKSSVLIGNKSRRITAHEKRRIQVVPLPWYVKRNSSMF
jgi:hypothetical protein